MVSTHLAAVIPAWCWIISWGYFLWLSGASRFQTLPSLCVIGCVLWRLLLFPTSPGAWGGLTWSCSWLVPPYHGLVHYLCFYICLYHHLCLYLLVLFLFLLCFPRSYLFLLSGYNSVWPGCTMHIVIVWFFRIASETWSSNYFRINVRTGNSHHRRQIQSSDSSQSLSGIICRALGALYLIWYCVIFQ